MKLLIISTLTIIAVILVFSFAHSIENTLVYGELTIQDEWAKCVHIDRNIRGLALGMTFDGLTDGSLFIDGEEASIFAETERFMYDGTLDSGTHHISILVPGEKVLKSLKFYNAKARFVECQARVCTTDSTHEFRNPYAKEWKFCPICGAPLQE